LNSSMFLGWLSSSRIIAPLTTAKEREFSHLVCCVWIKDDYCDFSEE
jgi:hypothetical protein